MSTSRRVFLGAASAAPLAAKPARRYPLYVGAYTDTRNKGLTVVEFDPTTGALSNMKLAAETPNPTFLAIHPSKKWLYAINEIGNYQGEKAGSVSAYSIHAGTGSLTPLNVVSSKGPGPCHISLDKTGKVALVANYGGGSAASYKIGADGRLSEAVSFHQHEGKGPVQGRQSGPHAHCMYASPGNRFAVACDLGIDQVLVYKLDPKSGGITPNDPPSFAVGAGRGPRHFAWHPSGKFGYVLHELAISITACRWDEKKGVLAETSYLPLIAGEIPRAFSAAEIRVHPNGRWLYASIRGKDEIVMCDLADPGKPRQAQNISVQGKIPRNFNLDPTGRWLLAANQNSDNIVVFRIDAATGKLEPTDKGITVGKPVCLRFVV